MKEEILGVQESREREAREKKRLRALPLPGEPAATPEDMLGQCGKEPSISGDAGDVTTQRGSTRVWNLLVCPGKLS